MKKFFILFSFLILFCFPYKSFAVLIGGGGPSPTYSTPTDFNRLVTDTAIDGTYTAVFDYQTGIATISSGDGIGFNGCVVFSEADGALNNPPDPIFVGSPCKDEDHDLANARSSYFMTFDDLTYSLFSPSSQTVNYLFLGADDGLDSDCFTNKDFKACLADPQYHLFKYFYEDIGVYSTFHFIAGSRDGFGDAYSQVTYPNYHDWLFVMCVMIFLLALPNWNLFFKPIRELFK